jgi:sarcosine oxidase subunit alpha
VSRFGPERFFLTTTTGNTDFMDQWLGWWLAGAGLCAHVTNVTGDYAAVNVAGPRARDTLAKLADTNLAPESFKYMACREVSVAGVPARLLRIGFVGEAGWEIHYPAAYGAYLWDAILEAGAEFGIAPFGVEAQRILRLEKGHPIIGQDTDALSTPFETELAWCIRDEKTDFIGKSGLAFQRARPSGPRLVGFVTETPDIPEGSTVVAGGRPAGRVTSCRRSPHTGSWIGMAVVPAELSTEGATLQIRFGGASVPARVVHAAFYDPEGGRVRS